MPRKKAEAPKVSETKKKPAVKKPVAKPKATTKKPVATKKPAVKKPTPRKKPTTRKKPEPKPKPTFKRKELSHEQMFPYESFIYRLEYQDGTEHRVCHFQCEAHRTKHIERYNLAKGTYYIDTPSS